MYSSIISELIVSIHKKHKACIIKFHFTLYPPRSYGGFAYDTRERYVHAQGRLRREEPPLFFASHRAKAREFNLMTDMIYDVFAGWLLLATVALVNVAYG